MSDFGVDAISNLLEETDLNKNGVSFQGKMLKLNNAEDCDEIIKAINECEKLEFLNLEGNTLGIDASKAIAKVLESKPELKRALWKDLFTGRLKEEIPKALQNLGSGLSLAGTRLSELDFSDNAFGPIGVEGLAGILSSKTCYQLEKLKLNNNGLGISGSKILAQALLECHTESSKEGKPFALKVFIAGRNRLENEGAQALSTVFQVLGSLEEVSLPQNGIYASGINALSQAFMNNPNLKVLNLSDNTVTKAGSTSIAAVLPFLQNLKILNLGDCLLKTSGAVVIANALAEKHTNLEELYMYCNDIKIAGGLAFVKAMKNKEKLKILNLNGNYFSENGCECIKNEMAKINKIACLDSLSEDEMNEESSSEENESDDEDNDKSVEENDENPEISDSSSKPSVLNVNGEKTSDKSDNFLESLGKMSLTGANFNSIYEFLNCPTIDNFEGIDKKMVIDYIEDIKNSSQQFYTTMLIPIIMKISSLSCCVNADISALSIDISLDLYKILFSWAEENKFLSLVNNMIIVHLGLIKSEDKNFKINWNTKGCLSALKKAIEEGIIPKTTEEILNCCLKREPKTCSTEEIKIS